MPIEILPRMSIGICFLAAVSESLSLYRNPTLLRAIFHWSDLFVEFFGLELTHRNCSAWVSASARLVDWQV